MRTAVNRRIFVLSAKRELTPENSTGHYPIGRISTGSFDGTWYPDKLRSIAKDCDSRIESSY
jgi:hypothetical protein